MTPDPGINPVMIAWIAAGLFMLVVFAFSFFFVRFARSDDPLADIETAHTSGGRGATRSSAALALLANGAAADAGRTGLLQRMGFPSVAALPPDDAAHLVARKVHAYRADGPAADGRGSRLVIFLRQEGVVTSAVVERVAALLGTRAPGATVPAGLPASALVISAQAFTKEAWTAASKAPIELVDGKQLESLCGSLGAGA